jgi:hypothetical protein
MDQGQDPVDQEAQQRKEDDQAGEERLEMAGGFGVGGGFRGLLRQGEREDAHGKHHVPTTSGG